MPEAIAQSPVRAKRAKGFFAPKIVRSGAFYIIAFCLVASVVAGILAIWEFAGKDTFWRMIATFIVVAAGTAIFVLVNGIFGEEQES